MITPQSFAFQTSQTPVAGGSSHVITTTLSQTPASFTSPLAYDTLSLARPVSSPIPLASTIANSPSPFYDKLTTLGLSKGSTSALRSHQILNSLESPINSSLSRVSSVAARKHNIDSVTSSSMARGDLVANDLASPATHLRIDPSAPRHLAGSKFDARGYMPKQNLNPWRVTGRVDEQFVLSSSVEPFRLANALDAHLPKMSVSDL
jgi:hypothetical protein